MKIFTNEMNSILNSNFDNTLVVSSLAGTGKTTLLEDFALQYSPNKVLYLVYNRSMLMEAVTRFSRFQNVHVETFHSLAKKHFYLADSLITESYRILDVFEFMKSFDTNIEIETCRDVLASINVFCSSNASLSDFVSTIDDDKKELFKYYWLEITKKNTVIPYLHDYYLKEYQLTKPLILDYDFIFVDEAQDLTSCMSDIVLSQSARKIFIGDPYQDIYGWRYSANPIKSLSLQYGHCKLTQSFRCSEQVASVAQNFLDILGENSVFTGIKRDKNINEQIAYIARTNMCLFKKAAIIPPNKKVYFVGGIDGYKFDLLKDVYCLFNNRLDDIKSDFIKSFKCKSAFIAYVAKSKEQDLYTLSNIVQKTSCVEAIIDKLFSQTTDNIGQADVVLTTAHKSKGLEFDNVELLDDFFDIKKAMVMNAKIPSEEIRLIYVAISRAKFSVKLPTKLNVNVVAIQKIKKLII